MYFPKKILSALLFVIACITTTAQEKKDSILSGTSDEVVVTGQYVPQSLRKSVYQLRVIGKERIAARAATSVQQVLNTELGVRFSNDLILGTSDVQLMGMSGRNVKILLDGVPMIDRGDTRESLNQIDIHSVERIEIVEGPMSVSYGSDALAGVINIITKKSGNAKKLALVASMQEETAGDEYEPFTGDGIHNQHIGLNWQNQAWSAAGGFTHNESGGWQGAGTGREKDWKPREQWLSNARVGYRRKDFSIWYRLDGLHENILSKGKMGANYKATDQQYSTDRILNQVQSEWKLNDRLQLSGILAYTDYRRKTETTSIDFTTGQRKPTNGAGEQDLSTFNSTLFRTTAQYRISSSVSLQPGIDLNFDHASGARISGSPSINDYAFFVSGELKFGALNLRPGLRFIQNSVYDAPPVVPALNAKIALNSRTDMRLAYAHGFRSPALRELYFNFFDASHSITGNPDLKAETSNSFTGSVSWVAIDQQNKKWSTTLNGFYNDFSNLISYGADPANPSVFMTINIDHFKTTGLTWENSLTIKQFQAGFGISYIGRYNSFSDDPAYSKNELPEFVWSPELNTNLTWSIEKTHTKLGLFYKYNGRRPSYQVSTINGQPTVGLTNASDYHLADLTITQNIIRFLEVQAGIKNLFDVTTINNTSEDVGGAHSGNGSVPVGYGRSFFLGLTLRVGR